MFPNSYQAKQYILNELEHIEADDLAKAYQAANVDTTVSLPKKRVVVLSPKKTRTIIPREISEKPRLTKSKRQTVKYILFKPVKAYLRFRRNITFICTH